MSTLEEIWRKYDEMEARLSAPLSERMIELAGLGPGMHVLDLATGRGEPAIPAAHRVGPSGSVLGVDIADSMLEMARERAIREGITNLEFCAADAAFFDGLPQGRFDATLVRWGLMYMDAPVEALARARRAMKPGGVVVAAVFAEPERAPFFSLPRRVLERHRDVPRIDLVAPGTFRYARLETLRRDIEAAGLSIARLEELEIPVMEAETSEDAIAWVRAFGMSKLLDGLPEDVQRSWERDFAREAEALRTDGFIRLGGVTRIVVASVGEG